jgi:hypothetical protein
MRNRIKKSTEGNEANEEFMQTYADANTIQVETPSSSEYQKNSVVRSP